MVILCASELQGRCDCAKKKREAAAKSSVAWVDPGRDVEPTAASHQRSLTLKSSAEYDYSLLTLMNTMTDLCFSISYYCAS